jgi:hypothetical protein
MCLNMNYQHTKKIGYIVEQALAEPITTKWNRGSLYQAQCVLG